MISWLNLLLDLAIILIFLFGFWQFRAPESAKKGNMTAAFALFMAVIIVLFRHEIQRTDLLFMALLLGAIAGYAVAMRVNMIQIPAMVAFQHGAGGVAAFLVSFIELIREGVPITTIGKISGILSLIIGAATFSGSIIASGKLANKIKQPPIILPKHNWFLLALISLIAILSLKAGSIIGREIVTYSILLVILSVLMGVIFSIRIGGADMPVLISFLNATAGIAASFCGIIIKNQLLVACGATVAASGSILTHVMCKAMNRSLFSVFKGLQLQDNEPKGRIADEKEDTQLVQDKDGVEVEKLLPQRKKDPKTEAISACENAKSVIIIPGYGMALAQAQFLVHQLETAFEKLGKQVRFAIHPVAGRMPGHMNVLLAEADVSYDKILQMDEINNDFQNTDLAIIIGACDVVNPAAINTSGTPISGMPILAAYKARTVLVCNLNEKPGYSGVENPLYDMGNAILLFGDAKDALQMILDSMNEI